MLFWEVIQSLLKIQRHTRLVRNRHYDLFRLTKRNRAVFGTGSEVSTKYSHTVDLGRIATGFE